MNKESTVNKNKKYIGVAVIFILVSSIVFYGTNEATKLLGIPNFFFAVLVGLISGILVSLIALIPRKKRDYKDIEHGSSEWGKFKDTNTLTAADESQNILFSENVKVACDTRVTNLNNHTLAFGGSGSGKSFYFVTPNLMQMNQSFVVTDPKGEHFAGKAKMLKENGYEIKVFNIVDFSKSMHFNPIGYFTKISDIKRFVTMLIENTTGDTTHPQSNDDFWMKAEKLWLMAILGYIDEECKEEEKTLNSVVALLDASQARDDDEDFKSAVDILFSDLEVKNPQSFAAKQYKKYKLAAGKTAKSILVSLGVRLADFDISEISDLVEFDELELDKIGDRKTAFFIILDDMDKTYNYIAAILIDTMFNVLKRKADSEPGQRLKTPVTCFLDEFANIGRFHDFHTLIAVIRSRGVILVPILQSMAQLKSIYKETWESIEGNCDITLFLGGKGESTQKYVAETMVGNTTIDTVSTGGSGNSMSIGYTSFNKNEQKGARKLIDENEVARLAIDECIINIRGFQPFKDKKLNPRTHKNFNLLSDSANKEEAYAMVVETYLPTSNIRYVTEIEVGEVA